MLHYIYLFIYNALILLVPFSAIHSTTAEGPLSRSSAACSEALRHILNSMLGMPGITMSKTHNA